MLGCIHLKAVTLYVFKQTQRQATMQGSCILEVALHRSLILETEHL